MIQNSHRHRVPSYADSGKRNRSRWPQWWQRPQWRWAVTTVRQIWQSARAHQIAASRLNGRRSDWFRMWFGRGHVVEGWIPILVSSRAQQPTSHQPNYIYSNYFIGFNLPVHGTQCVASSRPTCQLISVQSSIKWESSVLIFTIETRFSWKLFGNVNAVPTITINSHTIERS